MSYTNTLTERHACYYDANGAWLESVCIGTEPLTKQVKHARKDADTVKIVDSIVKHDSYENYINSFTKIRTYQRNGDKLVLMKTKTNQNY